MNQEKKRVPEKVVSPGSCLSPEKISAFLDGEENLTPEEEAHFQTCPHCRSLFRSYRNLGYLLADALTEEVKKLPDPERILDKVHERLQKEYGISYGKSPEKQKESFFPAFSYRPLVRVAAALLFIAFSFVAVLQFQKKDLPVETPAKELAEGKNTWEKGASPMPRTFSTVDIDSLIPAAAGNDRIRFMSKGESENKTPILIPYQVKQVWLRPGKATKNELEKALKISLRTRQKEWILEGDMTREKVVELVRKLAGKKYKLLTPVPPQPEDTLFLGTGKEKVQLYFTFLPEE